MLAKQIPLGIYEKALPAGECWLERLKLAKALGFDFVEMSLDETDARLCKFTQILQLPQNTKGGIARC